MSCLKQYLKDYDYTYGFNGMEKDDEISGSGNSYTTEFRQGDPRLGRFFAVDPLVVSYPWNSPYAFSENRVVDSRELEGLERINATEYAAESGDCFECLDKKLGYEIGTFQGLNPQIKDPTNIQVDDVLQTPWIAAWREKGTNYTEPKVTPTAEPVTTPKYVFEAGETYNIQSKYAEPVSFGGGSYSSLRLNYNGEVIETSGFSIGAELQVGAFSGLNQSEIIFNKTMTGETLLEVFNQTDIINSFTFGGMLNYTSLTGLTFKREELWNINGVGGGFSGGFGGSASTPNFQER